jgi:hypothetical protein
MGIRVVRVPMFLIRGPYPVQMFEINDITVFGEIETLQSGTLLAPFASVLHLCPEERRSRFIRYVGCVLQKIDGLTLCKTVIVLLTSRTIKNPIGWETARLIGTVPAVPKVQGERNIPVQLCKKFAALGWK